MSIECLFVIPISSRVKASTQLHASKLEMGALCLSLKVIARQCRWHNSRTFTLVDSQALLHACRKGRSGAENFRHGSRVLASVLIAAEIQLHAGYTPSHSNPSDPPSRGEWNISKPSSAKHVLEDFGSSKLGMYIHEVKRAHRHLAKRGVMKNVWSVSSWSSSCSSSCLGQPSSR